MRDTDGPRLSSECAAAREAIHARLDGDTQPVAHPLQEHLSGCSDCRAFAEELEVIGAKLRAIPELEFPAEALESVWSKTVRQAAVPRRSSTLRPLLAAAAMLTLMVTGLWILRQPIEPPSPTRAEVQQAAEEARRVLALTSRALRRAERTAVRGVLAGEVSPALNQVPVRWPSSPAPNSIQTKGTGS